MFVYRITMKKTDFAGTILPESLIESDWFNQFTFELDTPESGVAKVQASNGNFKSLHMFKYFNSADELESWLVSFQPPVELKSLISDWCTTNNIVIQEYFNELPDHTPTAPKIFS